MFDSLLILWEEKKRKYFGNFGGSLSVACQFISGILFIQCAALLQP